MYYQLILVVANQLPAGARAPPSRSHNQSQTRAPPSQQRNDQAPKAANHEQTWDFGNGIMRWTPYSDQVRPLPDDVQAQHDLRVIKDLRIHPHLRGTRLQWDIRQPPSEARYRGRKPDYSAVATYSRAKKLTIKVEDKTIPLWMEFWGPLTVRGKDDGPVTIQDVLDATYNYFHSKLTALDCNELRAAELHVEDWIIRKDALLAAYLQRLYISPTTSKRYLRVDILAACTQFVSLSVLSCRGTRLGLSLHLDSSRE